MSPKSLKNEIHRSQRVSVWRVFDIGSLTEKKRERTQSSCTAGWGIIKLDCLEGFNGSMERREKGHELVSPGIGSSLSVIYPCGFRERCAPLEKRHTENKTASRHHQPLAKEKVHFGPKHFQFLSSPARISWLIAKIETGPFSFVDSFYSKLPSQFLPPVLIMCNAYNWEEMCPLWSLAGMWGF